MYLPGMSGSSGGGSEEGGQGPVMTVGRINDPILARTFCHKEGRSCSPWRQLIADPYFRTRLPKEELKTSAVHCCNYCHGKRMRAIKHIHCAINPAGREPSCEVSSCG